MSDYNYEEQKAIGEKVKDRISALGLTRAEVAGRSKISVASLRMIINGQKYPTGPQIKRLCATLKITPNYLLFGTEDPDFEKGKSDSERFKEIFRTSILKGRLDKDNSAVIDRLILSMLASQLKKAEYNELMEFVDDFTEVMIPVMSPVIESMETGDVMKAVQEHYGDKLSEKGKMKEIDTASGSGGI